jgi:hypothetical protein
MDIIWLVNLFLQAGNKLDWRDIISIESIHYHEINIFVENLTLY